MSDIKEIVIGGSIGLLLAGGVIAFVWLVATSIPDDRLERMARSIAANNTCIDAGAVGSWPVNGYVMCTWPNKRQALLPVKP